ncbi:MAG TPA: hypothetical protein VN692_05205 [Steroidobacteraceae bacterium]|nr:hypothetical protein [Steroidobacteraceae bacterium]
MTASAAAARRIPSAANPSSPGGVERQTWSAMLVPMLGVAGLLVEASPVAHPLVCMCLDLMFGLALWTQIVLRFYRRVNQSPVMQPSEVKAFSRRLSRMVYLLLYVLVFARQAILMLSPVWRGGAIGSSHRALWGGPPPTIPPFLVYGLAALVLINGLTALWNHKAPKVPPDAA